MKTLDSFIKYLEEQAANHSIYVWGAQGQDKDTISEEWIKERETDDKNAARAIAAWKKACADGYGDVLRAFDCSGLAMYYLQNVAGIVPSDMSANSLMGKCETIKKTDVRRGDWVFKKYTSGDKKGQAYHIGYVVDDALNVIEAKGRDHGVIKAPLSEGKWNAYGRPEYYAAEIENADGGGDNKNAGADNKKGNSANDPKKNNNGGTAGGWAVARVLKVTKPLMEGDDVKALQAALIANNYHCGVTGIDGIYGKNTAYAVRCFQSAKGLVVDGKAGRYTVAALGGAWKG